MHPNEDIEVLAAAAADGDREALGVLYEEHDRPLFAYVYRRVQSTQVAEDVCADVWVRVVTSVERYEHRDGAGFAAWLFTIARHLLLTRYRDARRRPAHVEDVVLVQQACRAAGPLETAVRREQRQAMGRALAVLTPAQRQVLQLRYLEDLSEAETAARLGCSVGSVKQAALRGRNRLRAFLNENEPRTLSDAGLVA